MSKKHNVLLHLFLNFCLSLLIGIGCLIGLYGTYYWSYHAVTAEHERTQTKTISTLTLTITEKTSLTQIAHILKKNHFITSTSFFKLEAYGAHIQEPFVPGDYLLSNNMSASDIFKVISKPNTEQENTLSFTIPEGYTILQIANKLEDEGIIDKQEFLYAANHLTYNYEFLSQLPENLDYPLEGYLFPDTYVVRKDVTAEEIIIKMLNRFEEMTRKYAHYIGSSSYSLHELLTIASLIEGEAKLEAERPIISGVIYNRLDAHMKLQMCSTIQYLLDERKEALSLEDLKIEHPYNTYLHEGLPPGPINSPGESSFEAALMPKIHDYYYFVLKDKVEGSHLFSKTPEEHMAAKMQVSPSQN